MEIPKKKRGKGSEPKEHELIFIYERILQEMSDRQILADMEDDAGFPRRELSSFSRHRVRFGAARKVIEPALREQGIHDSLLLERKRSHWEAMTEAASQIVSTWAKYASYNNMRGVLEDGLCPVDPTHGRYLLEHLRAECPSLFSQFDTWEDLFCCDSTEVIAQVRLVAVRGVFKGTCEVCRGKFEGERPST